MSTHPRLTGHTRPHTVVGMELLTREEAASKLGVSYETLRRWATNGTGPPVTMVGRFPRYGTDGINAWLDANTEPPPDAA